MRARAAFIGLAAAAALATLPACSAGSKPPPPSSPAVTTTVAPSAPAPDLQAALLGVDDLPTGWSIDTSDGGNDNPSEPPCLKSAQAVLTSTGRVEADFLHGPNVPSLEETLGRFTDARSTFDRAIAILNDCKTIDFTNDGTKFTGRLGAMSYPTVGDQTSAYRLTVTAQSATIEAEVVYFRVGDTIGDVDYLDLGAVDTGAVQTIVQAAVKKLT